MATISITTPSDKDARISDAYDAEFPGRVEAGMTKAQWVKHQLIQSIRQTVRNYEANQASATARQTVEADVNGFTIT